MNKKSVFIAVSILLVLFAIFEIVKSYMNSTLEDANRRGIELYASTIKYAYTSRLYKTGEFDQNIDDLEITTTLNVYCAVKSLDQTGKVELHDCTIDGSKNRYGYVDDKVIREK